VTIDQCRAHIGHGVAYLAGTDRAEYGVITSVSSRYAFVRYNRDDIPVVLAPSVATDPADLELLAGGRGDA
jgi:hypothetical protein